MNPDVIHRLMQVARASAAAWRQTRAINFAGQTTLTTEDSLYVFTDGVLVRSAGLPEGANEPAWIAPIQIVELIGFLTDEGGFISYTPRWCSGAVGVLWNAALGPVPDAFTITAPSIDYEEEAVERSNVFEVKLGVRRPAADSMTRIQVAPSKH